MTRLRRHENIYHDDNARSWVLKLAIELPDGKLEWFCVGTFSTRADALAELRAVRGQVE